MGTTLDYVPMNPGGCFEDCLPRCNGHCWNADSCQANNTEGCHMECLGCYEKHSNKHCWVCKNYDNHGTCVVECPEGTYRNSSAFQCVNKDECKRTKYGNWWIHKNDCVNECPAEYEEAERNNGSYCRHCGESCTKWCNVEGDVDSISNLQTLSGCTHINGSLILKMSNVRDISEQVMVIEMSQHLSSIRYIKNALVIAWTSKLQSLEFLSRLKQIDGDELENGRFAIFCYENKILQKLWNFTDENFSLKIKRGNIGFFSNPYLCPREIQTLANYTGISTNSSRLEHFANGDKTACHFVNLTVTVKTNVTNATLEWDLLPLVNESYIGFNVHYIEKIEGEVLDEFDSNFCEERGWRSYFTSDNHLFLPNLEPYTEYIFYIKIYQTATFAVQTPMRYFRTLEGEPEGPIEFEAKAIDDGALNLTWLPPNRVNGELMHYQLYIVMETDIDIQNERDYCRHPRTEEGDKIDVDEKDEDRTNEEDEEVYRSILVKDCPCLTAKKKPQKITEEEVVMLTMDKHFPICDLEAQSKFGIDDCKDMLYRPVNMNTTEGEKFLIEKRFDLGIKSEANITMFENLRKINPNATSYILNNLKHFTLYVFYLSACNKVCGPVRQTFARTKKRESADDVTHVYVKEDDLNAHVEWLEPRDPNGAVVSYEIEYRKTDVERSKPQTDCLSRNKQPVANIHVIHNLLLGTYALRIRAVSVAGPGRFSDYVYFTITAPDRSLRWTVPLICVLLILVVIAFAFYLYFKRKQKLSDIRLIPTINPDYDGVVYIEDEWEIDRSDVEIQSELGHGCFGMVYCGLIKSKNMGCAVKTVNDNMNLHERIEFLNEASIMKAFSNSHHVVKLLGVVSKGQPPLVVMELMERGDLKKYLINARDSSQNITANEIYRMSIEIADGMAYLAAKKFVHRDLAARNCMVADDRTVKIGDFGMARDIYETDYYRKETKGLLPVRWMAPESLADGVFTNDSDVWSYGIVLWEIATLAEQPYQGLSNEHVLQFVVSKGKLERPSQCPDLLYEIMSACWCWRPNDRPTFMDIVERLEDHVGQDFKLVSFIHSREGLEYKLTHGSERVYHQPALGLGAEEHDLYGGHFNVSDEEVNLYVGDSSNRPRFLPESMNQRPRSNRYSPSLL